MLKRQRSLGPPTQHRSGWAPSLILGGEGLSQSIRAKPWQEEAKTSQRTKLTKWW